MSEHGAALQTYNQELVKCVEDLKSKRLDLQAIISKEESEKHVLEKHVKILLDKLTVLNKSLAQHISMRDNYDRTIKETETGFKKILESSQMLLNLAQHEANRLEDNAQKSSKPEANGHIEYNVTANL
ncbi:hypothetical protein CBL_05814 [Carabus blaptoides fortunei]